MANTRRTEALELCFTIHMNLLLLSIHERVQLPGMQTCVSGGSEATIVKG